MTALKGRIFTSLGFQPQVGWRPQAPRLGLKPQAVKYPPFQGGNRCYTGNSGIRPTAASAVPVTGFVSSSFSSAASPGLRNRLDSRLYWRV